MNDSTWMAMVCVAGLMLPACKRDSPRAMSHAVGASAPVAPPDVVSRTPDMPTLDARTYHGHVRPFKVVEVGGEASTFFYEVHDAHGERVELPEAVEQGVHDALYPHVVGDEFVVYDTSQGDFYAHEFGGETRKVFSFSAYATTIWYGGKSGNTLAFYESQPSCLSEKCDKNVLRHKELLFVVTLTPGEAPAHCMMPLGTLPLTTCGSVCQPVKIEVLGPGRVRYLVRGGLDDPGGEGMPEEYVTLSCPE